MVGLNQPNYPGEEPDLRYDKRRYAVPLERLAELDPTFDIDRAKDLNDVYQPYIPLDGDDGTFLSEHSPFQAEGLIWDKELQDYL